MAGLARVGRPWGETGSPNIGKLTGFRVACRFPELDPIYRLLDSEADPAHATGKGKGKSKHDGWWDPDFGVPRGKGFRGSRYEVWQNTDAFRVPGLRKTTLCSFHDQGRCLRGPHGKKQGVESWDCGVSY